MDPADLAFVKGVIAFVLVAGALLSGARLWLRERRRGRQDAMALAESVRTELEGEYASRLLELEDRVDFLERRLVRGQEEVPLADPRMTTPV